MIGCWLILDYNVDSWEEDGRPRRACPAAVRAVQHASTSGTVRRPRGGQGPLGAAQGGLAGRLNGRRLPSTFRARASLLIVDSGFSAAGGEGRYPRSRSQPELGRFLDEWLAVDYAAERQVHWVVRSAVLNFPDLVTAQISSALVLYSRSVYGHSDLGVNRRRLDTWLAALSVE